MAFPYADVEKIVNFFKGVGGVTLRDAVRSAANIIDYVFEVFTPSSVADFHVKEDLRSVPTEVLVDRLDSVRHVDFAANALDLAWLVSIVLELVSRLLNK